jgi:hypothetical protein
MLSSRVPLLLIEEEVQILELKPEKYNLFL